MLNMPAPIKVVIADYDPEWPRLAARYGEELKALGQVLRTVHHIGSTSVPGLAAKPVVDLMPLVTRLDALDLLRSRVEALGFAWHGELGIEGRRYCALTSEAGVRTAQLHFFETHSLHAVRHLAFRDYLRAHPHIAMAYEAEKRRARDLHPDSSHAYSDEKSGWIQKIQAEALAWRTNGIDRA